MGIKGLMKLLKEEAIDAITEKPKKSYNSKVIAIDASMQLYQFMIQIRSQGEDGAQDNLVNEKGEITSHIQGFLSRTINLLDLGIKPVYVFDGKPPALKFDELERRREQKKKASDQLEALRDTEDTEEMNKLSKRSVHITKEHIEDVKTLLRLMGIPFVQAPCEAEAQCAELVKTRKVYAAATEDMDCLTFGTNLMLRHLTDGRTKSVVELNLSKILSSLKLDYNQFVDFCILCGCDYTNAIHGIGPKRGLALIRKHGNIEEILKTINREKYIVAEDFEEKLDEIRKLFTEHEVLDSSEVSIVHGKPKIKELISFLVDDKGFNRERVEKAVSRMNVVKDTKQLTLDKFFGKKE